jgi:hypothetical protein
MTDKEKEVYLILHGWIIREGFFQHALTNEDMSYTEYIRPGEFEITTYSLDSALEYC